MNNNDEQKTASVENIIDWQPLDLVIRGWIAYSGFEKDQSDYQKRKELYE